MMRRWGMLIRVITKAFRFRPAKLSATIGALTVAATLSSAFLSLYFVLPAKMAGEFSTLGPNLVIAPRGEQQTFSSEMDARLAQAQPQMISTPWLYAVGRIADENTVLGGTDLGRMAAVSPGWRVQADKGWSGNLPALLKAQPIDEKKWAIAGEKAAAHFGWNFGQNVEVKYGERTLSLPLRAIVASGGSEDSQVFVPIATLQELTAQASQISLIQVRVSGGSSRIEQASSEIAGIVPELDARPLRQVVESETRVIFKVRALMYGLTAVILTLVILSVMTTVSGLILDRQKDIAVLKTLGGSDRMLALLFAGETTLSALPAAVLGYLGGFVLARWAAQGLFQSSLEARGDVFASVVAVTLAVALIATTIPMRLVRDLEPAVILKGN